MHQYSIRLHNLGNWLMHEYQHLLSILFQLPSHPVIVVPHTMAQKLVVVSVYK